ncbi:MAG TPA: hypothetical protein VFU00_06180, partial [Gemmatimonadales bacterium]|nr:hypothetical protein [Gemmatimonadales bacterium]
SSGAEALAEKVPRAAVVSAFGSIPSEVLFAVFEGRDRGMPPDLVYCGDDEDAKGLVAELIRDAGFDPLDVGPLRSARYIEPFAMLMARLAYEDERGPAVAYRFEWREEEEA